MNKVRRISFLGLLFVVLSLCALAQKTELKTVTDFYMDLPDTYFMPATMIGGIKAVRIYRESIVKVRDDKNGYLRIESPTAEGYAEVAIFKKSDGKYLVVVAQNGCGPSCSTEQMDVLSYDGGKWNDVKTSVWPEIPGSGLAAAYIRHHVSKENSSGLLVFKMPRIGRTVRVVTGDDDVKEETLFELNWDGSKFRLVDK